MQFSTLLSVFAFTQAIAAPAPAETDASAVDQSSLDTAVEISDSNNSSLEKRTLFLLAKAKYLWANALLHKGICYSCGSQNIGCGNSCCNCGASTQVSCSSC